MATKYWSGMRRHLREVTSFFGLVVLSALSVLLVQHLLVPQRATAQTGQTQQASPSDRAAAIACYDTAVNNGDLDGAVACFASNAVFVGAGRGTQGCTQTAPCTDIAGIRQQIQDKNIGLHECFTLRSVTVSGAVVTGERYAQNDVTRKNGVDGDIEDFIALVPGSQITFFANLKNIGDPQTARDLAISAGTQPAGTPIPTPTTPCGA
jgi:hypothetical protein